jgi:hypothetical protein
MTCVVGITIINFSNMILVFLNCPVMEALMVELQTVVQDLYVSYDKFLIFVIMIRCQ